MKKEVAQAQTEAIEAHKKATKAEELMRQKESASEDALNKLKGEIGLVEKLKKVLRFRAISSCSRTTVLIMFSFMRELSS
jgi:hypothetical protein